MAFVFIAAPPENSSPAYLGEMPKVKKNISCPTQTAIQSN
jgi:hypothetical protein